MDDSCCLTCNFKDCYKELKDIAYVTFCSHIFCLDCGNKIKLNPSKGCPACKKPLLEHQITATSLDLTADAMKLLLCGHTPKMIIEVASSALSFWNYQKKHEYLDMKRNAEHYRLKFQKQIKTTEAMAIEKDSRIDSLIKENEKLINESHVLKAQIAVNTKEMVRSKVLKGDFFEA